MDNITAIKDKSNDSKIFQNPEHHFTELFKLMPQLYTTRNPEVLEAIKQHADGSFEAVLNCTQSLGAIIAVAVQDKVIGANKEEIGDAGWLVNFLVNIAKACCFAKAEAEFELAKRETVYSFAYTTNKQL